MNPKVIELTEFAPPEIFKEDEIPYHVGESLWRRYGSQVGVEFPTPKTSNSWYLSSLGWVGYIPVTEEIGISLQPKVPLGSLFGMLEYAYRIKSFHFLDGLCGCKSVQDFFETLAKILSHRVLDRTRKGLYRSYQRECDRLPYIRGRLEANHLMCKPFDVNLHCTYEKHTVDNEDNQLLASTLSRILRSGFCSDDVSATVRGACRALQGAVSVQPLSFRDCLDRLYNRLNVDYKPMHALCRFFLENSGPSHQVGNHKMIPFLVNMGQLFELFVAEWLKQHLPAHLTLKVQEPVTVGQDQSVRFKIDLVLYDTEESSVRCVLDTKYKKANGVPSPDDIQQVVTYANLKGCREAVLVYPSSTSKPFDENVGPIRVRSMTFDIGWDLEAAGQELLSNLV